MSFFYEDISVTILRIYSIKLKSQLIFKGLLSLFDLLTCAVLAPPLFFGHDINHFWQKL